MAKYRPLSHNVDVKKMPSADAKSILVIMPNWLGDGVMATPLLRTLAGLPGRPLIAALARPLVVPVLTGMPYVQRIIPYCYRDNKIDIPSTARMLAAEHFDAAIILPNNWRSALIAWRAGIPVRVGYERDGRRWLLTASARAALRSDDEIELQQQRAQFRKRVAQGVVGARAQQPRRRTPLAAVQRRLGRWHNYQPVSTIEYYFRLIELLPDTYGVGTSGTPLPEEMAGQASCARLRMEVFCSDDELAAATRLRTDHRITSPYAVVFPGANFGASKCWLPERFADLIDWLASGGAGQDWHVLLAGAPNERPMLADVVSRLPQAAQLRVINLAAQDNPVELGTVKALVKQAGLVVCNDTGPRHFAAAFGRPLVTLFGPTDPRWAQTYDPFEQIVSVPVPCGPCQLKVCPIDHRCMRHITVEMVKAAVLRAIEARKA